MDEIEINKVTYRKIPGPFIRDPETHKITDEWSSQELEYLAGLDWTIDEKINGTNIRVIWDGHNVSFAGRSNNAQIPKPLLNYLDSRFGTPEAEELFEQNFGDHCAVMFGEGYGPGIQKGGWYRDDVSFIAFDVWFDYYLLRGEALDLSAALGAQFVPLTDISSLQERIDVMRDPTTKLFSAFNSKRQPEGYVARPVAPLRDRFGNQLIVKLKPGNI